MSLKNNRSILKAITPIETTSLLSGLNQAIADFGLYNTMKIGFFVIWRFIKYNFILAFISKTEPLVKKRILGGEMLLNRSGGGISWDLLVNGIREPKSTHFLTNEIKPGMNILEAGANIGYYLIQEQRLIGEKGHIVAFEPDPNNTELLQKNIELNNITNLTFHPVALGNKHDQVDFYIAERGNLSGFTFQTDHCVKVEMNRGDDLLAGQRIDYVRMDVEGFEFEILKGIERLLSTTVQGLFIEIHPFYLSKHGSSLKHLLSWLKERKFELIKAFCDYDWSRAEFNNAEDLLAYQYAEKMVWRSFFRKSDQ